MNLEVKNAGNEELTHEDADRKKALTDSSNNQRYLCFIMAMNLATYCPFHETPWVAVFSW